MPMYIFCETGGLGRAGAYGLREPPSAGPVDPRLPGALHSLVLLRIARSDDTADTSFVYGSCSSLAEWSCIDKALICQEWRFPCDCQRMRVAVVHEEELHRARGRLYGLEG